MERIAENCDKAIRGMDFNPYAPHGAHHSKISTVIRWAREEFQSLRPMRGATNLLKNAETNSFVSILAPHAGRNFLMIAKNCGVGLSFNPCAPCGAQP